MRILRALMACWLLALAGAGFGQSQDALQAILARNAAIAAQIASGATVLDEVQAQIEDLRQTQGALAASMDRIKRRAAVQALGRQFGQVLTERIRQLPRPGSYARAADARLELLAQTSDSNFQVELELGELGDLDAAVAKRVAAGLPAQLVPAAREGLTQQRELLTQLDALQRRILEGLGEAAQGRLALEQQVAAARTTLTGFLFWLPAAPSADTVGEILPSIAWTVSPANWRAAVLALSEQLSRQPFWPLAMLLAAGVLLVLRGRLQKALVSVQPANVSVERYGVRHPIAALAIGFALALPGPLLMWTAGAMLSTAPHSQAFVLSLADALLATAKLLLALSVVSRLLDRRGLAASHFGWDASSLNDAGTALRRFSWIFVPLLFLAALNGLENAPFANRESIGRLGLSLAMLSTAALVLRSLRREGPLMQRLAARAPQSWLVNFHGLWYATLVAVPLVVAAFAAAGYFVAAGYFFGLFVSTLFLCLGAALLYGLMALWVQVQRERLRRRQDEDAARVETSTAGAGAKGGEIPVMPPLRFDIATIGEQSRSLFDLLITALLLTGVWWLWRGALPALAAIGDYTLWTYTDVVGGHHVVRPVRVDQLLLAILVAAVTAIVVRNIGALLDILLLQRLGVQADATYAAKVMAQYAVTAAGVLIACNILGLAWGDMQWLVAALGVGLGFGLQEIVANFVSGLIVLAERPIRIGDIVTVGTVSGTVRRIRARATTVVDFDNKEVIIPNKAFITERVMNWTLSSQVTRLFLKVGVAYGSDIAQVQGLILDVLASNPDVLREPGPSAFLARFGDSSLEFEISVFVDAINKRLRVAHEINLALERVLRENGIEMPFPQRELHIRSAPAPFDARAQFRNPAV